MRNPAKDLRRLAVVAALLCLSGASAAEDSPKTDAEAVAKRLEAAFELHKTGKYLEALAEYDAVAALDPGNLSMHYNAGALCLAIWRYKEAERHLLEAARINPRFPDSFVWLARIEMEKQDYVRSFRWLKAALLLDPRSANGHAMLGFLLLRLNCYDWAARVLDRAVEIDQTNALACLGKAYLLRLRKQYFEAAVMLHGIIKRSRLNASAYQELGMTLSSMDRTGDGLRIIDRGIDVNRFLPALFTSKGFLLFKLKDIEGSKKSYREALELDFEYGGGHGILSYLKAVHWPLRGSEAALACARGESLLANGDFSEAEAVFLRALAASPGHLGAWLGLGACRFASGDAEGTLEAARGSMKAAPDSPLAHNLFLAAKGMLDETRKAMLSPVDYYEVFRSLPVPEVEGIQKVFTNFGALDEDSRKVVLLSVHPLRRFVPELVDEGVTHYILPFNRHLTDVEAMQAWRGKDTFDGRCYDAVRGVAGRGELKIAVTGVENLWTSTRMDFNTLAHEFAHQVHSHGMDGELRSRISNLFDKAKKKGRFLDYYSKSDEWEYFAQGYEAFISTRKRPSVGESANNTRQDLESKDPDLFALLCEITAG